MPPLLSRQPSAHELSDLPHLSDHDARTSLRIQREPYSGDDYGEPALAWPSTTTHAATALRRLFRWPWRGRSGSDKSSSCDINGYYYSAIDAQDSDHLRQEGSTLTTNFAQDAHLPASDQTTCCLSDALAQIHVCAVEGASLVDADVDMTERALCRCFALAAAVTTWCLLQPLIVFYVIAHFKHYHLRDFATAIALPLFFLSIVAGVVVGTRAAAAMMRVLETGEPPTMRRFRLYTVVLGVTVLTTLSPILLLLDGDGNL